MDSSLNTEEEEEVLKPNNSYNSNTNIIRDDEGFITYASRSKRKKKLNVGTRKATNTQLKSAERIGDIYTGIGRRDTDITVDLLCKE